MSTVRFTQSHMGIPAYTPHFQKLSFPGEEKREWVVQILREDLAHPFGQGNKYWKLKENLVEAINEGHDTLLTFGGAYSNHIHATAATGKAHGLKTIGVIRGEEPATYSPTLQFARDQGMTLHFVSREDYRHKQEPDFIARLGARFGRFHLIAEGGANRAGFLGAQEWGGHLAGRADYYCLAAGTGTTAAGIAKSLLSSQPSAKVLAFSALKNGGFLSGQAQRIADSPLPNLQIITDFHFGGYARCPPELERFMIQMAQEYRLPLDRVYTGKTLYGIRALLRDGYFPAEKTICFIHTGGLQGLSQTM